MIYFTADTHFCHSNIINLCGRPFSDVTQMNESLAQGWNAYVSGSDEIYILGDLVCGGSGREANEIIKNLKGKKYLIRGNHDKFLDDKNFDKSCFEWIKDYHVLKHQKIKFVLFHYPIFEWDGFFRDAIHLYGHVHNSGELDKKGKKFDVLGKRAINVGVDVNNFLPVSIEKVMSIVL